MFIGTAETTLDEKGRLALDRKWHLELTSGFIMTRGFDGCLCIFTVPTFELLMRDSTRDLGLSIASSDARAFARHLTAFAEQATLDKHGRVVIPPILRQFASVDEQVTVIGVVNRLEVWNSKRFAELNAQSEASAAKAADKMAP